MIFIVITVFYEKLEIIKIAPVDSESRKTYWEGLRSKAKWGASIRAARDDARFSNPEIPFLREPRDLSNLFFLLNFRKKGIILQTQ